MTELLHYITFYLTQATWPINTRVSNRSVVRTCFRFS